MEEACVGKGTLDKRVLSPGSIILAVGRGVSERLRELLRKERCE